MQKTQPISFSPRWKPKLSAERVRHDESSARDDEIARMKSEMQEMLHTQQQGMELLKIDNETLRRRLV